MPCRQSSAAKAVAPNGLGLRCATYSAHESAPPLAAASPRRLAADNGPTDYSPSLERNRDTAAPDRPTHTSLRRAPGSPETACSLALHTWRITPPFRDSSCWLRWPFWCLCVVRYDAT